MKYKFILIIIVSFISFLNPEKIKAVDPCRDGISATISLAPYPDLRASTYQVTVSGIPQTTINDFAPFKIVTYRGQSWTPIFGPDQTPDSNGHIIYTNNNVRELRGNPMWNDALDNTLEVYLWSDKAKPNELCQLGTLTIPKVACTDNPLPLNANPNPVGKGQKTIIVGTINRPNFKMSLVGSSRSVGGNTNQNGVFNLEIGPFSEGDIIYIKDGDNLVQYCSLQVNVSLVPQSTTNPTTILTPAAPSSNTSSNFCGGTKDDTKCKECLGENFESVSTASWTALGCIPTDPQGFVQWLLTTLAIPAAGGIAFLIMLFGVFTIIISSGNPEKLNQGKEMIVSAIAGLIMILFSVFLLRLIGVDILGIPGLQ